MSGMHESLTLPERSAIPLPWPYEPTDLEVTSLVVADLTDRVSSQFALSKESSEPNSAKEAENPASIRITSSADISESNSCEIIPPENCDSCQTISAKSTENNSLEVVSLTNTSTKLLTNRNVPVPSKLPQSPSLSSTQLNTNGPRVAGVGALKSGAQIYLHNSKPSTSKVSMTPKVSPKKKLKIPIEKRIHDVEQVKFRCVKEIQRLENAELPDGDEVRVLERIDKLRKKVFQIEENLSRYIVYEDAQYDEFTDADNNVNVANKIVLMETDLEPLNYMLTKHVNNLIRSEDRRAGYRCVTMEDVEGMLKIIRERGDCPIYDVAVPKEKENYENFLLQIVEMTNMRCRGKMFTQFLEEDFVESRNATGRNDADSQKFESEIVSNGTVPSITERASKDMLNDAAELPAVEIKPSLVDIKPSLNTRLMEMKSEGLLDETPDEDEPGEVIDLAGISELVEADDDDYEDDDIEILDGEIKKNAEAEASDDDIQEVFPTAAEQNLCEGTVKEKSEGGLAKSLVENVKDGNIAVDDVSKTGKDAIKRLLPPFSQTITDAEIQEVCAPVKRAKLTEDEMSENGHDAVPADPSSGAIEKSDEKCDKHLPSKIVEKVDKSKDDLPLMEATVSTVVSVQVYDPEKPELETTSKKVENGGEKKAEVEKPEDLVIDLNFEGFEDDDDEEEEDGEKSECSSPSSLVLKDTTEIEMIDLSDDDAASSSSNASAKSASPSANSSSPEIIDLDSEDEKDVNTSCPIKNNNNNSVNGGVTKNPIEDDDDDDDDIEILYEVTK